MARKYQCTVCDGFGHNARSHRPKPPREPKRRGRPPKAEKSSPKTGRCPCGAAVYPQTRMCRLCRSAERRTQVYHFTRRGRFAAKGT